MPSASRSAAQLVIARMSSVFPLSTAEEAALLDLPLQLADIRADQDIVREGDRPTQCFSLSQGFTCTYKFTGEGRRQIMAFHLPGDMPDLQSLHLPALDVSIAAITPCRIAYIQHDAVRDLCDRFPRIGSALWRETLIDGAIFREWIVNVGRRDAPGRMAHLLCELFMRLRAVGLAEGDSIALPFTQAVMADALGLSTVHVNRTLQELRKAGLVSWKGETLIVRDWKGLQREADFDPAYLHLRPDAA